MERLKRTGFTDPAMQAWTFENDNGKCPQMHKAYSYVEQWERVSTGNYGLILWGSVGTGKSYFAGCIANALMECEVSVCMTNFAAILNDLTASYKDRNEYIYERGSNENQNKMIRRHIPKGINFDDKTDEEIGQIESWINEYPRRILDYCSSKELFERELAAIQ